MKNFNSKLVYFPNISLVSPCKPVNFQIWTEQKLKCLYKEMVNEMLNVKGFFEKNCIGLSANQIGYDLSIFVISKYPKDENLKNKLHSIYINPKIVKVSEKTSLKWEGCVSETKNLFLIRRPERLVLSYQNIQGETRTEELSIAKSRIALHELDHINGVNINDLQYIAKQEIKALEDMDSLSNWAIIQNNKEYLI